MQTQNNAVLQCVWDMYIPTTVIGVSLIFCFLMSFTISISIHRLIFEVHFLMSTWSSEQHLSQDKQNQISIIRDVLSQLPTSLYDNNLRLVCDTVAKSLMRKVCKHTYGIFSCVV